jgi:hypothetical protein
VAGNRQCLREEVRDVLQAWNIFYDELALPHSIPQPVKPHVYGLRHLGGDGVRGEADSPLIVGSFQHHLLYQAVLLLILLHSLFIFVLASALSVTVWSEGMPCTQCQ